MMMYAKRGIDCGKKDRAQHVDRVNVIEDVPTPPQSLCVLCCACVVHVLTVCCL